MDKKIDITNFTEKIANKGNTSDQSNKRQRAERLTDEILERALKIDIKPTSNSSGSEPKKRTQSSNKKSNAQAVTEKAAQPKKQPKKVQNQPAPAAKTAEKATKSKQTNTTNTGAKNTTKKNEDQKTSRMRKTPLKIIPLGGLNEIGKNMTVFECGNDIVIVDCGLAFPDAEMPGIDIVIPDFSYIEKNADKLRGVVITHGHEDHIGGLAYLFEEGKRAYLCYKTLNRTY